MCLYAKESKEGGYTISVIKLSTAQFGILKAKLRLLFDTLSCRNKQLVHLGAGEIKATRCDSDHIALLECR